MARNISLKMASMYEHLKWLFGELRLLNGPVIIIIRIFIEQQRKAISTEKVGETAAEKPKNP